MCGIFGLSRAERSSIPDGVRFAYAATLAIEERGHHATGLAWTEGGWPHYWRKAGRASKVLFDAPLPAERLDTIIGHTRHATAGSPKVNSNNHPVVAPGLLLVHNGRCDNADALIELSQLGDSRRGTVDSQAIALILAAPWLADTHPADVLELVEGVAALAWITTDDPDDLHLARLSTRPLFTARTRKGDFLASSTRSTIHRTARMSGVRLGEIEQVPEGTYLRVRRGEVIDRRSVRLPASSWQPEDVPQAAQQTLALGEGDRLVHDGLVERVAPWRLR